MANQRKLVAAISGVFDGLIKCVFGKIGVSLGICAGQLYSCAEDDLSIYDISFGLGVALGLDAAHDVGSAGNLFTARLHSKKLLVFWIRILSLRFFQKRAFIH